MGLNGVVEQILQYWGGQLQQELIAQVPLLEI